MAGYTRQSTFADGDTITAALFNNEYNQLLNAFSNTGGHKHDGTANEGPVIGLIGDAGETAPNNKVLIDTTNNYIEFYVQVSGSPVQQLYIADGAIVPVTDNDIDLGTSSLQFKDLYINGTANIDSLVLATGSTVTAVLDEDDLSSDSATSLVTQQSVKAYIDAQVTAQDLDFLGDSGGALSIDLDSESLTIAGGTGLDTVGSGNTVTVNIDATVATLTGSQTLTNKTIDVDNNTVSNIEVDNFKASAIVLESEGIGSNDNDTSLPTSAAVKDYVDTQITAEDLDITTDSGTIAIDLDSETLTVSGGTGLDSSATGNAVTLAIDSTVTTLTGSQTLTNKTLTTPVISSISNTGTLTLPTSTDTLVGRATTDTLTNKTLTSATLTSPVINTGVSGTAFLDDDTFATATASTLASSESIKAYVDTTVAATNEVVEDTTPQLGGDLDLNSSDITGTGDINITGTIQSSGNITGTLATAAQPNITSVGTLTGLTTTGDINFGDDDKAIFGAGSDLEIYHTATGNHSIIEETGGGNLVVRTNGSHIEFDKGSTEYMARMIPDGAVELYYDSALKLATTSTGIDVTGTVTADGLTVDGEGRIEETGAAARLVVSRTDALNTAATASVDLLEGSAGGSFGSANNYGFSIDLDGSNNTLNVLSGNQTTVTKRLSVARDTGDISFYDDTGTSQALFWDASAESLGIGTTSPDATLHVASSSAKIAEFERIGNQVFDLTISDIGEGAGQLWFNAQTNDTGFNFRPKSSGGTNTNALYIAPDGDIGIGTTSPAATKFSSTPNGVLNLSGNKPVVYLTEEDETDSNVWMGLSNEVGIIGNTGDALAFRTGDSTATESMRIDSSGKVGIGVTNPADYYADQLVVSAPGEGGITIASTATSNNNYLMFADGTSGDTAYRGQIIYAHGSDTFTLSSAGTMAFHSNNTERMRIDSSGRVGIGTTSPQTSTKGLHVVHDATEGTPSFPLGEVIIAQRNFNSSQGCDIAIIGGSASHSSVNFGDKDDSDVGKIQYDHNANAMRFYSNATERMRIDSSGNLLVGVTSFSDSSGGTQISKGLIKLSADTTSTATKMFFTNANGAVGSITTNGSATAYNTSSDGRLKDVTGSARGLEVINELNPVSYNWKADGKADEGLIAQEVLDIVPNAVSGSEEKYYQMDYSKLVVHLVAGMKEQQTQIDALQSEINNLKGE